MLLEIINLSRHFGGIAALEDVSFSIEAGTVIGLTGDNGAGKSTLVKCITGAEKPDGGQIIFDGKILSSGNPQEARKAGIEIVYQHLNLCHDFSVMENIYLGREETRRFFGIPFLAKKKMKSRARELLTQINAAIDPDSKTGTLSGGQQQTVAIARSLLFSPKLLILDEPTASLGASEVRKILDMILHLKKAGMAIILISHRQSDILAVADRQIMLEQGRLKTETV